jgi:4-hydroxy-2-oxoheptanedioate aldolase
MCAESKGRTKGETTVSFYEIASSSGAESLGRGLRQIINDGRVAFGGWCMIASPFVAEVVSASGCDWLCIDQQHGLIGDEAMFGMVQAAAIRRTPVLVRVPWNAPAPIMRALDAGADGVIVPMVNTAEEAASAVAASRYPPTGYRSFGPLRAGMAQPNFAPGSGNEQVVLLVMVETLQAFENLDSILDVPGLDGVLVGPFDLTISYTGETAGAASSARDVGMIEEIARACTKRGLAAAISGITLADAPRWREAGYTMLSLPSDAALIGEGMAAAVAAARSTDA